METKITQPADDRLQVIRHFDAAPAQVWKAWTEPAWLDQWWAPRPWKAVTSSLDLREGGAWLYHMEGPGGERQYCRFDYETIDAGKSYSGRDAFTDEQGTPTEAFPNMHWQNRFSSNGEGTLVEVDITFASTEDLKKIVEMGFKEGFTMAHGNLDELLRQRKNAD
ncbi:MAG: SRPBCC domain-containing protein [Chitinophagaceae bacterium]|nr:MAG: SRPBCC domain-containing protein [Chitinophagaceae bacterium]